MKQLLLLLLLALNLPIFGHQVVSSGWTKAGLTNPNDCRTAIFEETRFTQCIAVPSVHEIAMKITGRDGIIFRGFPSLARESDIANVAFGMNGGMYDARSRPIGYYVENGKKLHGLNLGKGAGNFYLKPNGVFFGTGLDWKILPSTEFEEKVSARPDFGTQSGPMLVIDGEIHPEIAPDGPSKYVRNAVGVDSKGRAHFVISDKPVSFGRMARMMRDKAATPNALYLDGEVSALWNPATGRVDGKYPLGPLILVSRTGEKAK